jgi:signal transduction histidine kinase
MISSQGKLINFSRYWPIPHVEVTDRDYFKALRADPKLTTFISQPVRNRGTGTWTIYIARKFVSPEGEFLGLILGAMELQYFEKFFSTIALGPGSSIALFRTDGTLLVRYPRIEGAVGQSYGGVLKAIENKDRGTVRLVGRMDNKDRILSVHRLENFPVAVSVGLDVDAALADWRRDAQIVGGGVLLFVLVVLATVLLGVRQIRSHELLVQARTEQAEAEKARAIAESELLKKERLSVLGQLTATVAHELRNPLSAIRNTLPLLRALAADERSELTRPLARIERSIKRCDHLVASLLEYTKERELAPRPVLFDDWLSEVLDEQTLPPDITLERSLRAENALVMLDTQRFHRVVINLIENAAQAITQHAGELAERKLLVSTKATDHVELTISDTGPGIAPDVLPRVFEPLFSTKSFGTGLGLPTVKQIVEQHGGTISIASALGKGATARVVLPRLAEQRVAA